MDYRPLVDGEKKIAELLSALHHTRRPDAVSILRTGLGVRLACANGHPSVARALRKPSPAALLASWVTTLAITPLDTIRLDFASLADPSVIHAWAKERPALLPLAALRSHGQALDPEYSAFIGTDGDGVVAPAAVSAANEQIHQDAQLCLYALAQLWLREDRPIEIDADESDSRQVHLALTTLAYRLAQFCNDNWGEALSAFVTTAWDDALVDGLCQSDAPEHFAACAQVLRGFRATKGTPQTQTQAGTEQPEPAGTSKRPRDEEQ